MRNRYFLLGDVVIICAAVLVAYLARFDAVFLSYRPEFYRFLATALLTKPIVFALFGLYRRLWRYASVPDLVVVAGAVTIASAVLIAVLLILGPLDGFSRGVLLNDWLLTLIGVGGIRLGARMLADARPATGWPQHVDRRRHAAGLTRRVLIAGAGKAGMLVARELQRNPQLGMAPAGFVDDDAVKKGKYAAGIRVLGSLASLVDIVRAHKADHVIIAMPSAPGVVLRQLFERCQSAGVTFQTMPGVFELLDDPASVNRLRTVEIADLLRRAPVRTGSSIAETLRDHVVLVTGAGGSIGSELVRQVAHARPLHLVMLGHGENSLFALEAQLRIAHPDIHISVVIADIRDRARMEVVFDRFRPHTVFHAAAHKHVPLMEANVEDAVTNNIIGTREVLNQALRTGATRFVLISSDKAVQPSSVMGATKRVAEAIVRRAAANSGRQFVVVRFGNVLGSRGSVVGTFKEQIERGGPLTITHPDTTRFFMTIPEAVYLVLQAAGEGKGGELFVLEMGEPVKVVDLARDLVRLSGLEPEAIPIVFTGMRPGEKLHEVLYDPGMEVKPTAHPDVRQVVGADPCMAFALEPLVDELDAAARCGDRVTIERLLKRIVPGYVPVRGDEGIKNDHLERTRSRPS
ncbi:MAG: nucleoside-diphosphate sugar epimerase/dehydratase [Vicinamibacterales bacterium]